jgi:hypothetical protein
VKGTSSATLSIRQTFQHIQQLLISPEHTIEQCDEFAGGRVKKTKEVGRMDENQSEKKPVLINDDDDTEPDPILMLRVTTSAKVEC